MYYLVLNNAFNRCHCPSLIGKRFVNPPVGARVRKLPVRKDRKLTVDAGSQVAAGEPAKPVTLD